LFKIIEAGDGFIKVKIGPKNHDGAIQWELAILALRNNKQVIYVIGDNGSANNEFVMTPEEAKEIITLERVKEEIDNLKEKKRDLNKDLKRVKKESDKLEELLIFLKNSPK